MTKKSLLLFAALLWIYTAGFSQISENDTIPVDEVVITGSKQYRSIGNTTQKIDVISSQKIVLSFSGNNNIAEFIAMKPGASVSVLSRNDANWGTYAGIGPKYGTYMLNGLPVDAFVDPMSLDLMAAERIEIQRGPASVLYPAYLSQDFAGIQSPLTGTINIILQEHIDRRETAFRTSYGSYNTFNTQAYHQDKRDNLNYFAGVNYESSDYTNYGTEDSWLNMQKDPEYIKMKLYGGANFFYGTDNKNKFGVFVNKTKHKGDAGRVYRGFEHNYTSVNISQRSEINKNLSFNASSGIRIYDRTYQSSFYNQIDSFVSNDGVYQRIIPADINLTLDHGANHSLIVGVDYQNAQYYTFSDPGIGYDQYGNKSRAFQYGIYAQEELNFGGLTARGGIRYNFLQTSIDLISGGNPGEPVTSYQNFLWSGGLKYSLESGISIFANAGNSFIAPGLKAMGGTIALEDEGVAGMHGQLPNPDLRSESGLGSDFGVNAKLFKNLKLSARGFYMKVDDAVVDVRVNEDPSQSRSINAGNSSSTGFEVEASHTFNDLLSWFVNYTYMKTEISNDNEDQNGAEIPFAPEHVANAGFTVTTNFGLSLNTWLNYNGGFYDSNSISGRKEFVPGVVINTFVSQRIVEKESFSTELFVQGYNLTNNSFELPWQFQNTGIAVNAGFNIVFK